VGECLREIAEVLACRGVDLIGIELQRPGERQQLLAQGVRALGFAIMASAVTSQKEQMVNVSSSSSNPVSVPSTRSAGPGGTVGFTLAEFSGGRVGFSGAEFVGSAFDFSDMLPPGPSVKAGRHRRTAGWAYRADRVAGSRLLTAH